MVGTKDFPPDNSPSADILTLRALSLIFVFGGILALIYDPPSFILVIIIVVTFWLLSSVGGGDE